MLHLRELGLLDLDVLTAAGMHARRVARLVGNRASAGGRCAGAACEPTASIPTT